MQMRISRSLQTALRTVMADYITIVVVPAEFWKSIVSESTLGRRAWALQERLLSPAVIHFGKSQIAWDCKGFDACETFPHGLPESIRVDSASFNIFNRTRGKLLLLRKEKRSESGFQRIGSKVMQDSDAERGGGAIGFLSTRKSEKTIPYGID